MESGARAFLIVLGMIVFANYRNGTLGDWLKAKFFNSADPKSEADDASTPSPFTAGPVLVRTGLGGGSGQYQVPIAGTLTSRFGAPRPNGRTHAGVDYAAAIGTPVKASRAGRVTYAGPASGYGLLVKLDHGGGYETRYAHLSKLNVGLGQEVAAGATIAASGNTGNSTGPHLHFEVRRSGVAIDPLSVLGPAPTVVSV